MESEDVSTKEQTFNNTAKTAMKSGFHKTPNAFPPDQAKKLMDMVSLLCTKIELMENKLEEMNQ